MKDFVNPVKQTDINAFDWNNLVNQIFVPMEVRPVNAPTYRAEVNVVTLGPLQIANIAADAEIVNHKPTHSGRPLDRKLFLHLPLQGSLLVKQNERSVLLEPGDMAVCDSAASYTLEHGDRCRLLVLTIPFAVMKNHLPHPDQLTGIKFHGDRGVAQTLSLMVRSLWLQAESGVSDEIVDRMVAHLLDMLSTCWMSVAEVSVTGSAAAAARHTQICRYIETNLRDPELTTSSVAAAFRISTRYLHMIFELRQETVSGYILRRRLEQCAKQFADPLWNRRTITEIAFDWGFNNATHFARVFRNKYGQSPRDYRNALREGGARTPMVMPLILGRAVA